MLHVMTLAELKKRADKEYAALKERKRRRYKLARDLGFDPKEAKLLSGHSESRIFQLARERTAGGV